jgi:hypothetical protein
MAQVSKYTDILWDLQRNVFTSRELAALQKVIEIKLLRRKERERKQIRAEQQAAKYNIRSPSGRLGGSPINRAANQGRSKWR